MSASLLVTFGAAGAAWDGDQIVGPVVEESAVLDTTGAGDAFCGTLAAALVVGTGHKEALQTALAAGVDAVKHVGAQRDQLFESNHPALGLVMPPSNPVLGRT